MAPRGGLLHPCQPLVCQADGRAVHEPTERLQRLEQALHSLSGSGQSPPATAPSTTVQSHPGHQLESPRAAVSTRPNTDRPRKTCQPSRGRHGPCTGGLSVGYCQPGSRDTLRRTDTMPSATSTLEVSNGHWKRCRPGSVSPSTARRDLWDSRPSSEAGTRRRPVRWEQTHGDQQDQPSLLTGSPTSVLRRVGRLSWVMRAPCRRSPGARPNTIRSMRRSLRCGAAGGRMHLLRTRAALRAPIHHPNRQENLPEIGQTLAYTANREGVAERCLDPAVPTRLARDLTLIGQDDRWLTAVERDSRPACHGPQGADLLPPMLDPRGRHAPGPGTARRHPGAPPLATRAGMRRLVPARHVYPGSRRDEAQPCLPHGGRLRSRRPVSPPPPGGPARPRAPGAKPWAGERRARPGPSMGACRVGPGHARHGVRSGSVSPYIMARRGRAGRLTGRPGDQPDHRGLAALRRGVMERRSAHRPGRPAPGALMGRALWRRDP